jgi:hypothetical protein
LSGVPRAERSYVESAPQCKSAPVHV